MCNAVDNLVLDSVMPGYDVVIAEHQLVRADPVTAWQAARGLDLMTVRSPILTASMWLRGLPARLTGRATPVSPQLVISNGGLPGWLVLGETDRELVFGAVGRFWQPVIEWRKVSNADFVDFDDPGWGKIAANFTVTPYGRNALVSYECRTTTTDPLSQRQFLRYWWLIRPFVAHIMRATLRTIKANAEGTGLRRSQ